jgi:hypothetical protein
MLQSFKLPFYLSFLPYAYVVYKAINWERQIRCLKKMRAEAYALEHLVDEGLPVHDRELECFYGWQWDFVPWDIVDYRLYLD